jgi:hypothetical protein
MTVAAAGDGHHGLHAEQHDPHHHRAEADLVDKGLSEGAVGLFGGTILGISSVAPAFFRGETLVTNTPALVAED